MKTVRMIRKNNPLSLVCAVFLLSTAFVSTAYGEQSAVDYYSNGLIYESNEDWVKASEFYLEAIDLNPSYYDAWYHLSKCSYNKGDFDLTLNQLDNAEKYSRDNEDVHNLRGMTYIALGDFNQARSIFNTILKSKPNNLEARFGLAELDLFNGKITGAEKHYQEALRREHNNRRALLSLAVVSSQLGKRDEALKFINEALVKYSGEAEVHYFASIIFAYQKEFQASEKHCRIALDIDPNYIKAMDFLGRLLYIKMEYGECVNVLDERVRYKDNSALSLFLKASSLNDMGLYEDSLKVFNEALEVNPNDEITRALMEQVIKNIVPLEDSRRAKWAEYHIKTAQEYEKKYDREHALYEYTRALLLNGVDETSRTSYALSLKDKGLRELYLSQLLFIQKHRKDEKNIKTITMDDTIEAYEDILTSTMAKKWNVEDFYLDKSRFKMGFYFSDKSIDQDHIGLNRIVCNSIVENFAGLKYSCVVPEASWVRDFGDAYEKSRKQKLDYFVLIKASDGARDFSLEYTVYNGKSGYKMYSSTLYGHGNNSYSDVLLRLRNEILNLLPVKAKVLNRDGNTLLCDLGLTDDLQKGSVFKVLKKDKISLDLTDFKFVYKEEDVLGLYTINEVSEEISEGLLDIKGFYDRVNIGDDLVFIEANKDSDKEDKDSKDTNESLDVNAKGLGVIKTPNYINLIRSIY